MRTSQLRNPAGHLAVALGVVLAACGGAAASPSPSPEPPLGAKVLLRMTTVQALPPPSTFAWLPAVVVTLDGRVLSVGPIDAMFPGPLLSPIVERPITAAGWARVVEAARAAGLLTDVRDFTGGQLPPGSQATRLEIVAGGRLYDLVGDATRQIMCIQAPCVAPPGTPEAFAGFVNGLLDPAAIVGHENLGPERRHDPAGYAVMVNPAPPDDQGVPHAPVPWPLPGPMLAFGKPLADGSGGRCGLIAGAEAALVAQAFAAARQTTPWRDPGDGSLHGIVVRPLLPGDEDPCAGLV